LGTIEDFSKASHRKGGTVDSFSKAPYKKHGTLDTVERKADRYSPIKKAQRKSSKTGIQFKGSGLYRS